MMKVKLVGIPDGKSSQLRALATFFAQQMGSVSNG